MTQQQIQSAKNHHRRDTLLWIVLPMAALVLLIVAAVAVAIWVPRDLEGAQLRIISDLMLMVIILCPMLLCLLPLAILMVVSVFGLNRVHDMLVQPLRKVSGYSLTAADRTSSITDRINRQTINTSARLGFIYRFLGTFEDPTDKEEDGQHEQ